MPCKTAENVIDLKHIKNKILVNVVDVIKNVTLQGKDVSSITRKYNTPNKGSVPVNSNFM